MIKYIPVYLFRGEDTITAALAYFGVKFEHLYNSPSDVVQDMIMRGFKKKDFKVESITEEQFNEWERQHFNVVKESK